MTNNFTNYRLFTLIFFFAVLLLEGCSFNFSTGGSDKITDSEAETIAVKTLQSFNRSVQKGDFGQFHQTEIAPSFKNELTTEKFNAAFAKFIDEKIDIRPKEGAPINWSPKPEISGKFLNLNGSYPAKSGRTINFKLQYVKETGDWNLKYIDVNVA